MIKVIFVLSFLMICGTSLFAQSVRSLNNDGVDHYNKKNYSDAEANFKKSLDKDPHLLQGQFNLGDAYYKENEYNDALKSYEKALELTKDPRVKAKIYHNIGNALLKTKKYKESIGAYKNSLRFNPNDNDTKYNLSYALSMLRHQQKKNQEKNQNQKNNKNKNQKKNGKQNKQSNQNKQKNQNKPQQNQTAQSDQLKQQQKYNNQMSKDEAERILQALRNSEMQLQKQLRKKSPSKSQPAQDW